MRMVWERLAGSGQWLAMMVIAAVARAWFEIGLLGEGAGNKGTSVGLFGWKYGRSTRRARRVSEET